MSIVNRCKMVGKLYFSMMNHRNPSLMLFGSWWGEKFADNSKYLYLYAVKNGYNAYWITNNHSVYRELKEKSLPVAMRDSNEGIRLAEKAGVYFFSTALRDINDVYCGGAILINLWHGIPLKKIMYDNKINNDDYTIRGILSRLIKYLPTRNKYVVSTSDEVSKIYSSAFRYSSKHILQWGQPRNDCFFDGSLKKKKCFDIHYNKLIVYMPTHRNEGKTRIELNSIFDLEQLEKICEENSAVFMIKKHFYHKEEKTDLSKYSHIFDCTQENFDTQELLYNADLLVTDYSSCFIDYLLLDRPILFHAYDYDLYLKNDRQMYFEFDEIVPGAISYQFKDFCDNLVRILSGDDSDRDKRHTIRDFFYDKKNQGIVSDCIISKVLEGNIS